MNERFYVDDLISCSNLLTAIKSFGGDTLRRISPANPCTDTLSISRRGDTLQAEDYLWMVLQLDNDTSAVDASTFLTALYQNKIRIASLNFIYKSASKPFDTYYSNQLSLAPNFDFDIEKAWDYEKS